MDSTLKFSYHLGTIFVLGGTALIWFLGIGGRDLYILPLICWLPFAGWRLWQDKNVFTINWPSERPINQAFVYGKWALGIFFLLCCLRATLRYLSFQWSIWDSGIFSNIIYNISQGELRWSHYEVHPWADHFTPSIGILAPFFWIYPHFIWVVLAKILSYTLVPLGFWQLAKYQNQQVERAIVLTLLVSSAWLLWYKPTVASLWYEWQPSCLAPPVIVFCFLWLEKKEWFKFSLGLLFLLGLKEHMGIVPLGFGCYLVLQRKEQFWTGFVLIVLGLTALFSIIYGVMPFFRGNQPSWSVPALDFLGNIPGKVTYSWKLLFPLAFLPLLYFRIGIMAGPAIGVNLIAAREAMRSNSYHYDDVAGTLLLIAVLVILSTQDWQKYWKFITHRTQQILMLVWIIGTSLLMPSSIGQELKSAWPTAKHSEIHQELSEVKKQYPLDHGVAVQSSLGVHFQQREVNYIAGSDQYPCGEKQADQFHQLALKRNYWLLVKGTNSFMVENLDSCVHSLEAKENFELVGGYDYILLYVNNLSK
ncbi:MAG: DUF2079 domain-containing protein [SAR324 cluster bacterium]|nr:DUF2079 domain-containing protein [SAR324 cluster bacterium]